MRRSCLSGKSNRPEKTSCPAEQTAACAEIAHVQLLLLIIYLIALL
jgi:hypothetical protein